MSAKELRRIFESVDGCRGFRKVDLPFITLGQFWRSNEHPDPDEDVLQGVIGYLQARWEEFTERDVGIFIDISQRSSEGGGGEGGDGEGVESPVF